MSFPNTYQAVDSSTIKPSFENEGQDVADGLELIEEVDEPIELPKPKKKYFSKVKVDSTKQLDTIYGIKNGEEIPIRNTTLKSITENTKENLFNPTIIVANVANWQIITLIITVLLLGLSKAFSNNRFRQTIKAIFRYSVAQEITREEKVFFHRANLLLFILHLLSSALFIYSIKELLNSTSINTSGFLFFLIIIGCLITAYTIKYLFSKVLFFILDDTTLASEYIFNVSLYNSLFGVILIPTLFITYFLSISSLSIVLYISIPLMFIIFFLRLIRLFIIGTTKGISYFYIFLYICTLEILPLVVLLWIFILK